MLEFCPLCYKNGQKRKIKLSQINLEEAVWLCEFSECPWPFGSEDFTFVSRKVGETWSSEWETCKPPSTFIKSNECFPISLSELGLDTPPVTPGSGNDVHKDPVFVESTSLVTSLNLSKNNPVQIRTNFVSSNNNGSGDFSSSNDADLQSLERCFSSQEFIDNCNGAEASTGSVFQVGKPLQGNLSVHESTVKCKKWLSDNSKSADHSLNSPALGDIQPINVSQQKVTSNKKPNDVETCDKIKRLPIIRSIEKTNVKLKAVIVPSIPKNNPAPLVDLTGTVEKITEQTPTSNVCKNISETCKIENKTLVIDGIIPISLSYEIPSFVEESETVPSPENCKDDAKEKPPVVDNIVESRKVEVKATNCQIIGSSKSTVNCKTETRRESTKRPVKRTGSKPTKYQGFNFGSLKKKLKPNGEEIPKFGLPNPPSPDNASTCSDLTWTSETSCMTTTTVDSKVESIVSNVDSNSKSTLSLESSSPAISNSNSKHSNSIGPDSDQLLDSSLNLDIVLDELLLNEGDDLPQGFGDDWIVSLFN